MPAIPQPVGERFEAGLARDDRLGLALLLVRQIQIFQRGQVVRALDARAQVVGKLALPLDLGNDETLALADAVPGFLAVDDRANGHLVEGASLFLAIARDEGHGGAFLGQAQNRGHAGSGDPRMRRRHPGGESDLGHGGTR